MGHEIALVGAGRMGSLHARNAAASPRFSLKAVADHDEQLAGRLASELGSSVASYADILADPAIRAVIVASSTASHLENVLAAVNAGKAVFCEKPLSLDAGTLASALPEIERSGMPVFVAFNRRFDPHLRELKRQVDSGAVGALETLHIVNHDPAAPRLEFVPRSGGLFKDFAIHDFDTAKLVLRSKSGTLCMISNSRRTGYGYDQRVELFGSKGALRVDNVKSTQVSRLDEAGEANAPFPYSFAERYAEAYKAELDHFADVLDGSATPSTGPGDSLAALRLADAAELSARTGAPVQLSVEEA
jgi:myo-inositol 2-dehydrogenase/D-chiro-inositol 1-dehydrogenase